MSGIDEAAARLTTRAALLKNSNYADHRVLAADLRAVLADREEAHELAESAFTTDPETGVSVSWEELLQAERAITSHQKTRLSTAERIQAEQRETIAELREGLEALVRPHSGSTDADLARRAPHSPACQRILAARAALERSRHTPAPEGDAGCPECGTKAFALVEERQPDGSFAPGRTRRCFDCKAQYTPAPEKA